ncbi:MAG: hypothetical protein WD696_02930 [Bryobacteraceae bacterium]
MQLSDVMAGVGEDRFGQLVRSISLGKLKTYQVYERLKTRAHLNKLNTDTLRKAIPRLWSRVGERDEEFASDLAQAVLVSHLNLIVAVLDFLGVPHESGFFAKDLNAEQYLTDGWEQRAYDHFRSAYPEAVLVFYINHLGWELGRSKEPFLPNA